MAKMFPNEFKKNMAKTVTFQVTEQCQLRCTYCYEGHKKNTYMSLDVGKQAIDFLLNSTPENNPYINPSNTPAIIIDFIGGEPLLAIDLIEELIKYFKQRTIELNHPWAIRHRFSICSNGIDYFNPKFQNLLKKYSNEISFSISIDGTKKLHDACRIFPDGRGSYDIAIQGVKHYMEHYNKNLDSKMTLAPANLKYLYESFYNLVSIGYKQIYMNCIFEEGWTNKDATLLYNELKKAADYMIETEHYKDIYLSIFDTNIGHPMLEKDNNNWCGGTMQGMLAIDRKGNIYPCLRYMETSLGTDQPPMIVGNIYDGIGHNPADKYVIEGLEKITRKSQSTEKCFNCPIAQGCAWCSAYNYQKFGTANHRATFICPMHKARVLANVYYWNKLFQHEGMKERFKNFVPEDWALEIIDKDEFTMLNKLSELN